MRCASCRAKSDLLVCTPGSFCFDCAVTTTQGDGLCSSCSRDTNRCQHCRSLRVQATYTNPLKRGASLFVPVQELEKMTKRELLRVLFDQFLSFNSNRMHIGEFRRMCRLCHKRQSARKIAPDIDIVFKQTAGRCRSLDFNKFIWAILSLGQHVFKDGTLGCPSIEPIDALFSVWLMPLAMETVADRRVKVAKEVQPMSMQSKLILSDNDRFLRLLFALAVAPKAPEVGMTIEDYLHLCRRCAIMPDRFSKSKLEHIFAQTCNSDAKPASYDEFLTILHRLSNGSSQTLALILLRISDYTPELNPVFVFEPTRIEPHPAPPSPQNIWSESARHSVNAVFALYARRCDTGGRKLPSLTHSTFLRFLSDFNRNALAELRIKRPVAMLVLQKIKKRKREDKSRTISLDEFTQLVVELAADTNTHPLREVINRIAEHIESMLASAPTVEIDAIASPCATPLNNPSVCVVLMEHRARLRALYDEFASLSTPLRTGLRLGQHDIDRMTRVLQIVPNLLTVRALANIVHNVRLDRSISGMAPFEIDDFLNMIARMAVEAFAKGVVLERDCDTRSDGERVVLFLAFVERCRGGLLAALPRSVEDCARGRERVHRSDLVQRLEQDVCIGGTHQRRV